MSLDVKIKDMIHVMNELRPLPSMELCHYVGLEKSKYILNANSDLFCGHSNFMNDKNESWSGCRLFLRCLQQVLPSKPYAALADNLRENSAMAKMNGSGFSYFMPYVMSLTPNEDSAYQWRHYTDNQKGGYCFRFNVNLLRCAIQKRNKYNEYSALYLAPCFYIGEDTSLIELFMAKFINCAQEELTDIRTNFRTKKEVCSFRSLIGAIFTLAPLFKDRRWRREHEWRLILTKRPMVIGEQYARTRLSEICGHPLNLMTSITISPHGNQSELRWNLESKFAFPPEFIEPSGVNRTIADYYITHEPINSAYEEYVVARANINKSSLIVSQDEFEKESSNV